MSIIANRQNLNQEKTAYAGAKSIKTSMQKLGLVTNMIKGMHVDKAMLQLQFLHKKVAHNVKEVLASAIANAENNYNLDIDKLYVSEILIGKAFVMKRMRARARGRSGKITKPFSNLKIFVSEKE